MNVHILQKVKYEYERYLYFFNILRSFEFQITYLCCLEGV